MAFQSLQIWKLREKLGIFRFVFDLLAPIYFCLVTLFFATFNKFQSKQVVSPSKNPLLFLSATKAAEKIRGREIKSVELVQAYIDRINEVNDLINAAVYTYFDEALAQGQEADRQLATMDEEEIERLHSTKPLFGLPFTAKDTWKIKGKKCTAGVVGLKNYVAEETAPIVQRMLDAGAIFLASTNVPQNAMWIESNNALFGRTNNPYDCRRTSGGSSGGEGAIIGAGASLMGIGSDIGGSIRIPSFFNGVFGFLTTPGTVPADGHIPSIPALSYKREVMLRVGPIVRYAEDIPLLARVMAGGDKPHLRERPLKGVRLFYSNGLEKCPIAEPLTKEQEAAMFKAIRHLETVTETKVEHLDIRDNELATPMWFVSFKENENEATIDCWMNSPMLTEPAPNCKLELLKFFLGRSDHALAMILEGLGDEKEPFTEQQRKMLIEKRDNLKKELIEILGKDGVIVWPSLSAVAHFHNELLFKQTALTYMGFWNMLGFPVVQCPTGLNKDGIPTGVQVITAPGNDGILLGVAEELSKGFGGWVAPGQIE